MLTINVIHRGDEKLLNGALNGEKFNLPYDETLLQSLKDKQAEYSEFTDGSALPEWEESVKGLLQEVAVDIIETSCPDLVKDPNTGNYFVEVDGVVSKSPVPEDLVEILLESVEKEIDPTPIVKAWIRFLRNPNFSPDKAQNFAAYITAEIIDGEEAERLVDEEGYSTETALNRATYNDVAITQEGLIVCKKYARLLTEGWEIDPETNEPVRVSLFPETPVTVHKITGVVSGGEPIIPDYAEELYFEPAVQGKSGDEFFSGDEKGHIIQVGKKHTLEEWDQVNTNDYTTCVKGLHVGGWQYVQSYKSLNCQLLECFVDPAEIGAICDIRNSDGAIRVREYFVYGAVKGRTKGIYHSSNYAQMKDVEWEEYKAKAVANANEILDEIQEGLDNLGL